MYKYFTFLWFTDEGAVAANEILPQIQQQQHTIEAIEPQLQQQQEAINDLTAIIVDLKQPITDLANKQPHQP